MLHDIYTTYSTYIWIEKWLVTNSGNSQQNFKKKSARAPARAAVVHWERPWQGVAGGIRQY